MAQQMSIRRKLARDRCVCGQWRGKGVSIFTSAGNMSGEEGKRRKKEKYLRIIENSIVTTVPGGACLLFFFKVFPSMFNFLQVPKWKEELERIVLHCRPERTPPSTPPRTPPPVFQPAPRSTCTAPVHSQLQTPEVLWLAQPTWRLRPVPPPRLLETRSCRPAPPCDAAVLYPRSAPLRPSCDRAPPLPEEFRTAERTRPLCSRYGPGFQGGGELRAVTASMAEIGPGAGMAAVAVHPVATGEGRLLMNETVCEKRSKEQRNARSRNEQTIVDPELSRECIFSVSLEGATEMQEEVRRRGRIVQLAAVTS